MFSESREIGQVARCRCRPRPGSHAGAGREPGWAGDCGTVTGQGLPYIVLQDQPPPHLREAGGALRAQRVHGECARRALYTSLTNEPITAGWAGGKPVSTSENYLQVLEMAVIKPPREIWESETTSCAHSKCFNATSVWRITNIADTKTTIGLFLKKLAGVTKTFSQTNTF